MWLDSKPIVKLIPYLFRLEAGVSFGVVDAGTDADELLDCGWSGREEEECVPVTTSADSVVTTTAVVNSPAELVVTTNWVIASAVAITSAGSVVTTTAVVNTPAELVVTTRWVIASTVVTTPAEIAGEGNVVGTVVATSGELRIVVGGMITPAEDSEGRGRGKEVGVIAPVLLVVSVVERNLERGTTGVVRILERQR